MLPASLQLCWGREELTGIYFLFADMLHRSADIYYNCNLEIYLLPHYRVSKLKLEMIPNSYIIQNISNKNR